MSIGDPRATGTPVGARQYMGGGLPTYGQAVGYYGGQAAPQQGLLDQQRAGINTGLAATQGLYGQGQTDLRNQSALDLERLGLNRQSNQLAMQGPQADMNYYNQLAALAQQSYGKETGLITEARGLRGQQTDIGLAEALRAYQHNNFMFGSDQTAKGAWSTKGTREGFSNLSSVRDLQEQALRNQLAQANVGFSREELNAYDSLQKQLLGSGRGSAQARMQLDQLGLKAKEFGVDERELANKLQSGLTRLNLDQSLKVSDIMGALSSNDAKRMEIANQIIAQAMAASGGGMGQGPPRGAPPAPTPTSTYIPDPTNSGLPGAYYDPATGKLHPAGPMGTNPNAAPPRRMGLS